MPKLKAEIDLITDLVLKLKEKQGTERKEVHAMIDKAINRLINEARIDELEQLTIRNFDTKADYKKWSKSVINYIGERLKRLSDNP